MRVVQVTLTDSRIWKTVVSPQPDSVRGTRLLRLYKDCSQGASLLGTCSKFLKSLSLDRGIFVQEQSPEGQLYTGVRLDMRVCVDTLYLSKYPKSKYLSSRAAYGPMVPPARQEPCPATLVGYLGT